MKSGRRPFVGTIRRGFLFNEYLWNLKVDTLPPSYALFTVWFKGTSETGDRILVRTLQHRIWFVRLDSSINNFHLVAAIAFIPRED